MNSVNLIMKEQHAAMPGDTVSQRASEDYPSFPLLSAKWDTVNLFQ